MFPETTNWINFPKPKLSKDIKVHFHPQQKTETSSHCRSCFLAFKGTVQLKITTSMESRVKFRNISEVSQRNSIARFSLTTEVKDNINLKWLHQLIQVTRSEKKKIPNSIWKMFLTLQSCFAQFSRNVSLFIFIAAQNSLPACFSNYLVTNRTWD